MAFRWPSFLIFRWNSSPSHGYMDSTDVCVTQHSYVSPARGQRPRPIGRGPTLGGQDSKGNWRNALIGRRARRRARGFRGPTRCPAGAHEAGLHADVELGTELGPSNPWRSRGARSCPWRNPARALGDVAGDGEAGAGDRVLEAVFPRVVLVLADRGAQAGRAFPYVEVFEAHPCVAVAAGSVAGGLVGPSFGP